MSKFLNKKAVIIIILIALPLAVYFVFIGPSLSNLSDLRLKISDTEDRLTIDNAIMSQWQEANSEQILNNAAIIRGQFPRLSDLQGVFSGLETFLLRDNLAFEFIEIHEIQKPETGIAHIQIELLFSGLLDDLVLFIREVENYPYVLQIEQIYFQEQLGKVEGTLELALYFIDTVERAIIISPETISTNGELIALRTVYEKTGARVYWDNASQTALVIKNGIILEFPLNSLFALKNGEKTALTVRTTTVGNRTMVCKQFILENLSIPTN